MLKLMSLAGLAAFLALAWLMSTHRDKFPKRTVLWGLGIQFFLALLILKTPFGLAVFEAARKGVAKIADFAAEGSSLVFGPLADAELLSETFGPDNAFIFAITISATIILVSALSSLLYHWGVLPRIVQGMAWAMQKAMKTSGSETLAAAANVFVGQTEAPLIVKPYLDKMTPSELMALMVGGMATIAGGVLVAYVSFGAEAGHLLTASVMSAPATLMIAKIMVPETEESQTASHCRTLAASESTNSIDALCRGSTDGLKLSANVLAMLITFTAVVAMVNFFIGWITGPLDSPLTLQKIFGWLNAPFAFLMGVPAQDCVAVGQALGERIVLNEFFGYLTITGMRDALDPRSFTIASYALCGFANFASVAIQIGGIGVLAPGRRVELAQLGLKAMAGGLLACYCTACVAGILL